MANFKTSSIAKPLESHELTQAGLESAQEQPRDFHFAVTWVTLFAHLDLIEAADRRPRVEPANNQALVPVVAAPLREIPPKQDPRPMPGAAAWEMVVPKMVRTGSGTFAPSKTDEAAS